MPKLTNDYSFACIYGVERISDHECLYVGSTSNLIKRRSSHSSDWKMEKNLYQRMRDECSISDWSQVNVYLIEKYPVTEGTPLEMKHKLEEREGEWIKIIGPALNDKIAGRPIEEQFELKREKERDRYHNGGGKEKSQKWAQENKESVAQQHANYYQENKEHLNAKNRQYAIDHAEGVKAYKAQWAKEHTKSDEQKALEKERRSQKISCPHCDTEVSRGCLTRHIARYHK